MSKATIQINRKLNTQKQIKQAAPILSELYIQLPKPQINRKIAFVNNKQPIISFDFQADEKPNCEQKTIIPQKIPNSNIPSKKECISRVKSAEALANDRSEAQIISEWIKNIFQKKKLLGPKWQEKFKRKKVKLLRDVFECLKAQQQSSGSEILKTQSKYRPFFNRKNHIAGFGLQKLDESIQKILLKSKRLVFSNLLRFLAFQHNLTNNPRLKGFKAKETETQYHIQQASPKKINFLKPPFFTQTPKTPNKYDSSKNIELYSNEYALAPSTPVKQSEKRAKRQQNFISVESNMSKNSDKTKVKSAQPLKSKSQTHHIAIGEIGGNFKYEFNQHNYIVVQPEQYNIPFHKINDQFPFVNPPSPISHQFTPNYKFQNQNQREFNCQPLRISQKDALSSSKKEVDCIRPSSHNPFTSSQHNKIPINNQISSQKIIANRKYRAASASPNIKISFSTKEEPIVKLLKRNDYQQENNKVYTPNIHKLGTVENKKLRQHYELNSYGNELIPQDYLYTQSPNYIYSSPISPKPKQLCHKNIHVNFIHPNPPSPTTQITIRSPRNTVYQSFMSSVPQIVHKKSRNGGMMSPQVQLKRKTRQKIMVVSSNRIK